MSIRGFGCWSASSSSSIGKNNEDEEGGENEVASPYESPLDTMESLEEVLPIRRGISKFYNEKSKSFTNLKEAESSHVKDLGKPNNFYTRRQRELLRHQIRSQDRFHVCFNVHMSKRESDDDSSSENQNNS